MRRPGRLPPEADPKGDFYAFERGANKSDGKSAWTDVIAKRSPLLEGPDYLIGGNLNLVSGRLSTVGHWIDIRRR